MSAKYPKKLIEVALPLDDINKESSREKSIRHGHPSTLHLWWSRKPLATCRAVLFAQLVNDPGGDRGWGAYPGQTKEMAQAEREKLFDIIRDLVKWENTNNEEVLNRARVEIRKSWEQTCKLTGDDPNKMPPFLDPFAGGGSIPLEAQRLGLEAHASDLNPVAVMICKALIEIPPKFANKKPVGPKLSSDKQKKIKGSEDWSGAKGLAEDVRRYGHWMREKAFEKIGHLYPQVDLPKEYGGGKANVIAWLWVRTVASPNPAFKGAHVPLTSKWWLCNKKGKETWVEPVIASDGMSYEFEVRTGKSGPSLEGTVNRNGAKCILSGTAMPFPYVRDEAKAGRMGAKLMAIVAEGIKGRVYLKPSKEMEQLALSAQPDDPPDTDLPEKALGFRIQEYGMTKHRHLFTPRQLVALTTFSDLVLEAREKVISDARAAGWPDDGIGLNDGGTGATAYGDAVAVYLAFGVDKLADRTSALCSWDTGKEHLRNTFGRQAIPMIWDYSENNPFSESAGHWQNCVEWIWKVLEKTPGQGLGLAIQNDVLTASHSNDRIVSFDPPYFDNIGYADLSDFFYVWQRRINKTLFPQIFSTLLVPKTQELIASPYRHGGRNEAETFFLDGMTKALGNIHQIANNNLPVTIYYAFKQSDSGDTGTSSTGWETFLEAINKTGFSITGTWPMRTELSNRPVGTGTNALASSIVLVCRKRPTDAPSISRKQFLRELDESLPEAIETMIGGKGGHSPVAPVDLAQAAIGPGMAVYSRYSAVLNADGSPMPVREALIQINRAIDEYFTRTEGHMDPDTRFCIGWFEQYGYNEGPFGEADVLARAKVTSVDGVVASGTIQAGAGKVRILKYGEYPTDWDPTKDKKLSVWEALHHLIRALQTGEKRTGELLAKMPDKSDAIRQLAYRLYTYCERKGWAEEARQYNELIASWSGIVNVTITLDSTQTQDELGL